MFLETCPFLVGCSICWHIIVHNILWCFFVFLWYQMLFLLFHFLFCLFGFSIFFLVSLARSLSILFIFFQKPALSFIDFFLFFKIFILFISSLIFIISFSADFRCYFVLLFLILLSGKLGSLFEIFLVFWGKLVALWTSLLGLCLLHPIDSVRLYFHCHLSQVIFKFPLWFHYLPIGFLVACCLVSM